MKMKEFFANRGVDFYLRVFAAVTAFVPVVYLFLRIETEPQYLYGAIFGIAAVVLSVVGFIFSSKKWADYLWLGAGACIAAELSALIAGGVLSIIDYVFEINFWGDATQFSAIIGFGIVVFLGCIASVAACFFRKKAVRE